MLTGAARLRRGRWRRAKSRRKLQAAKDLGPRMIGCDDSLNGEPPDRLLLSALRYWEVERDLIEERLATRSATAVS